LIFKGKEVAIVSPLFPTSFSILTDGKTAVIATQLPCGCQLWWQGRLKSDSLHLQAIAFFYDWLGDCMGNFLTAVIRHQIE